MFSCCKTRVVIALCLVKETAFTASLLTTLPASTMMPNSAAALACSAVSTSPAFALRSSNLHKALSFELVVILPPAQAMRCVGSDGGGLCASRSNRKARARSSEALLRTTPAAIAEAAGGARCSSGVRCDARSGNSLRCVQITLANLRRPPSV
eukprot:6189862-Pleurochrysis_carterae.AAC.1